MSEPTFNQNPYFTNEQLEFISKEYRTIPVDGEGRSYEPEYNSMQVRSDVLKLISDVRQARREQYAAENSTIEVLTKQITDEVAISAAAIVERDRLRKELALKDATIADLNHNRGLLSKELEEARKIRFPRQANGEGGWEIDYKFLDRVENVMISNDTEYPADTETIEAVLLALETVLGQEGEGNQNESQDGCPET